MLMLELCLDDMLLRVVCGCGHLPWIEIEKWIVCAGGAAAAAERRWR